MQNQLKLKSKHPGKNNPLNLKFNKPLIVICKNKILFQLFRISSRLISQSMKNK